MSERERPSIAVVGAGRVGQALGRLLFEAGYPIDVVASRTVRSARAAVRFIGAGRPVRLGALDRLEADLVLIATPDDAIARVAEGLPAGFTGIALHTSGALGAAELEPLRARGARVGSMHPLQSFATPELGVARVAGSVFAIEGDREAVALARRLARDVGGRPVRLKAGTKALYHAAAVLAAGHVTALVDMSVEAMRAAGLDERDAIAAILPLVRGTLSNVEAAGTAAALTGPFARGDEGTIARNREALAALDPALAEVYDLLGERSRKLRLRSK